MISTLETEQVEGGEQFSSLNNHTATSWPRGDHKASSPQQGSSDAKIMPDPDVVKLRMERRRNHVFALLKGEKQLAPTAFLKWYSRQARV